MHGTEDYTVKITMNKDSVEQMHCSCPYSKRGARCEHNALFPNTRHRNARLKKLKHSVETETDEMFRSVKEEKYHRFLTQYGVNTDQ